jgi:hypothetical protein
VSAGDKGFEATNRFKDMSLETVIEPLKSQHQHAFNEIAAQRANAGLLTRGGLA